MHILDIIIIISPSVIYLDNGLHIYAMINHVIFPLYIIGGFYSRWHPIIKPLITKPLQPQKEEILEEDLVDN